MRGEGGKLVEVSEYPTHNFGVSDFSVPASDHVHCVAFEGSDTKAINEVLKQFYPKGIIYLKDDSYANEQKQRKSKRKQ